LRKPGQDDVSDASSADVQVASGMTGAIIVEGDFAEVPRDTVVVPRPAKGGSVVIRSRFLDYTGVLMLHCHMMNHEETGMMQTVEVYKE
jgi:FtsP/CotA-like multicopper oxidase with cupredoxin domain